MVAPSPSAAQIRTAARAANTAPVGVLTRLLLGPLALPDHLGPRHTLLAVCPNSKAVIRAALHAAQEARTPLLYAATLNQVDRDGGYTGWTPAAFASFVAEEADRRDLDVPIFLGLDHGGPWGKDDHVTQGLDCATAMAETKRSLKACVSAGYDLLHLDPAAGPPDADPPLPVDTLVDRTVELMRHAESVRQARGRGPIAYEVGTDETRGGLQTEDRMRTFLRRLRDALEHHDLPRPSFVVGDVGTTLDADRFDAERAERFADAADAEMGALVKGHYTDDVATPSDYPLSGMGGANVGPGLSAVEARAVRNLAALEEALGGASDAVEVLRTAVVESGRWKKWLHSTERGEPFEALPDDRKQWLVNTGSRYVWSRADVKRARAQLYENVAPYRDAEAYVQWRIKSAILRYMHAFNLIGLSDRLSDHLPDVPQDGS
ncbi:MAG: class II D-tagatose-bisphosphate aldolase non-catalytic subunit [Salinibacter sp.]|uniref:class II D-tagatose-bisphosphate aldolase non-catalytic subunit n=1 Tax=Salinibacter sp. TaxID=2065818 RepID=UPI0035D3F2AE